MGTIGRPRDWSLTVRFRGGFRMKPGQSWMPFDAWQYNCTSPITRLVDMRIDAAGVVPMWGRDTYIAGRGRMIGKVLGLIPVADGQGTEFDRSELVTYLNDALMLAPSMLLVPAARWSHVDEHAFDIELTDRGNGVSGRVFVDDSGRLVHFRTDDRWYAGVTPPVRTAWSTPVEGWTRSPAGRPVPTGGTAAWELPDGDFTYVRGAFVPSSLRVNVAPELLGASL